MYIEFNNSLKLLSIDKKKTLIFSLGNTIEWFNFGLFVFMAPTFSYNLGNALICGSTPLVVTLLTEKAGLITPAYYLIFMAGITLITSTTSL